MYWNLTLAAVPAVLALVLFRRQARAGVAWWIGVGVFVAFLPNAPYVLTDVKHYAFDVAMHGRHDAITHYLVLFGAGLAAYVVSMWRCTRFLALRGASASVVVAVNLAACGLCAVGVYLGRVGRFNSWDLVRAPHQVGRAAMAGFGSHLALVGMAQVFAVLAVSAFLGIVTLDALDVRVGRGRDRSAT
jgi:uncharacterized membrane protein